jgi:methylthioribose-1-phosphate isomerase
MSETIYPVRWQTDRVILIDQTKIPQEFGTVEIRTSQDMAMAIKT